MLNQNKISYNFQSNARKFVTGLGKGDALLPVVLLEATVVAGRTYNAYDRGGFVEARERFSEEILGSIFWLGGVVAFNKLGDKIGKKLLKLDNVDFEVGKDAVRNPLKNFLKQMPQHSEKTLAAFKFTKVISSILLANAIIGFIVPKLNQAITKKYQKSFEKLDIKDNKSVKKPSFEGGGVQTLLSLANSFENDAKYKLISTDAGIAGGRAVNARNKHERREILFRDLSSVYFYIFCKNHMGSLLNLVENGRTTRLDPVTAHELDLHIRNKMENNKAYTTEEFEKLVLGDTKVEIPKGIKEKFKNNIINLNDFKMIEKNSDIVKCAELMSQLQPKIEDVAILTSEQVKDVYSSGLINNPQFLNNAFSQFTNKKSIDPFKFVPEKDLRSLKQRMVDYIEDIIKKAKSTDENITTKTLEKANKANFMKNTLNLGIGFAISAYFLSTAIPHIQYWMTRKRTGENKFPGIQNYKDKG